MLKLPSVITNVIHGKNKVDLYDLEVRKFHVDNSLPEADSTTRLDGLPFLIMVTIQTCQIL